MKKHSTDNVVRILRQIVALKSCFDSFINNVIDLSGFEIFFNIFKGGISLLKVLFLAFILFLSIEASIEEGKAFLILRDITCRLIHYNYSNKSYLNFFL